MKFPVFHVVSNASWSVIRHRQKESISFFSLPHHQVFIHRDEISWTFCLARWTVPELSLSLHVRYSKTWRIFLAPHWHHSDMSISLLIFLTTWWLIVQPGPDQQLRNSQNSWIPDPQPTPIYILSMASMVWNISVGQLGLAVCLCSLPALLHLLISWTWETEKRSLIS